MKRPQWSQESWVSQEFPAKDRWKKRALGTLKTAQAYWTEGAELPREKITAVLRGGYARFNPTRRELVEAYDALVVFMRDWLTWYEDTLNTTNNEVRGLESQLEMRERWSQFETDRADRLERENASLRWALSLAYEKELNDEQG